MEAIAPFVVLFGVLIATTAALVLSARRHVAFENALERLADERGLHLPARRPLRGRGAPRDRTRHRHRVRKGRYRILHTRFRAYSGLPERLRIAAEAEGLVADLSRAAGRRDVEIGDPPFDGRIALTGEAPHVLRSWMDARTRAAALRAAAGVGSLSLSRGTWTLLVQGRVIDPVALGKLLDTVHAAAHALVDGKPLHVEGRLQQIAEHDPLPLVRHNALKALIAHERADRAWLKARLDGDDDVAAVLAAEALGEDGRAALRGRMTHPDPAIGRAAVLALARLAPSAEVDVLEDVLLAHLQRGDDLEIIDALGAVGTVRAVPALRACSEGLLRIGPTARRAEGAVRMIQSRVVGAERGSLSVVDPAGQGCLALAQEGRGALPRLSGGRGGGGSPIPPSDRSENHTRRGKRSRNGGSL